MTPADFCSWLAAMRAAGVATSDAHCGRLLGRTVSWVQLAKRRGADTSVALACAALLAGLVPYGAVDS